MQNLHMQALLPEIILPNNQCNASGLFDNQLGCFRHSPMYACGKHQENKLRKAIRVFQKTKAVNGK